jgi:hypothetical protein
MKGAFFTNEKGKVMDIHGNRDDENRDIIVWRKHGGMNQQWDVVYHDAMPKEPKKGQMNKDFGYYVERPFYIVSEMPKHRYLDMINRNLVIKTPNGFKTQQFWFDQKSKTIKSAHNKSWSFDIQNAGRSNNLQMWNTNSGWWQLFKFEGQNIVNVQNKKVLDVSGNRDVEGQNCIVWNRHNGANQRWRIVYVDSINDKTGKGLNRDFGFYGNRPFYIRSKLPMQRFVEVVGGRNVVLKTFSKDRRAQQFVFDTKSKTIKSYQWKDKSFDIQNSGKSSNLQVWKTNARWFQLFRYQGGYLINEKGKVMDVHGNKDQENRNIIVWNKHKGMNQQWDIIYADDMEAEPKKGDLNKDFGMYVERPFHIVS